MVNQRDISKYVWQAKKDCPVLFRKKLAAELQSNLSDFLETHPECTMDHVRAYFGSPEKFADEYLLALDAADRQKLFRKAKWVRKVVFIGTVIVVLVITVAAIWIVNENSRSAGYYYTNEIEVLQENTN